MKKESIINLIKYHTEKDEPSFRNTVYEIVNDFYNNGDKEISQYLLSLIRDVDVLKPQDFDYSHFNFLHKDNKPCTSLIVPDAIMNDILSIASSISKKNGIHRFLFTGQPGTGKTEACRHIARLTNRQLVFVNCEEIIDSHLGQTPKNIVELFTEINRLMYENVIVVFDELDSLVLDRIDSNDLREMGRAVSSFIKQLDLLDDDVALIATTNLGKLIDKAVVRRFGAVISFDRYNESDIFDIADAYIMDCVHDFPYINRDSRLLKKIINLCKPLPSPSDIRSAIRLAISFSDSTSYGYLRKLFSSLLPKFDMLNIEALSNAGFTLKEIEKLTSIPKSSVSRRLIGGK